MIDADEITFLAGRFRTPEQIRAMAARSALYAVSHSTAGATVEDVMRTQGLDRQSACQALSDLYDAGLVAWVGEDRFWAPHRGQPEGT